MADTCTLWVECPVLPSVLDAAGVLRVAVKDDSHITILYVGDDVHGDAKITEVFANHFKNLVARRVQLHATISGWGHFLVGPRNYRVPVALVDSLDLCRQYAQLRALCKANDIVLKDDHGFQPHVTLEKVDEPLDVEVARQVRFAIPEIHVVRKFGSGKAKRYERDTYKLGVP